MDPQRYISHKIYDKLLPKHSIMLMFFERTPDGKYTGGRPQKSQLFEFAERNNIFALDSIPGLHGTHEDPEFFNHAHATDDYKVENKIEINSVYDEDLYLLKNKNVYIDHSFEPIQFDVDDYFWNNEVFDYYKDKNKNIAMTNGSFFCNPAAGDRLFLLHSERSSEDIEKIRKLITVQKVHPVYWFANGYLCATEWYRHLSLDVFKNFKDRPIRNKFVCLNRLIDGSKKYRIDLLNLLNLEHAVYSLPANCPNTGRALNDIVPNNTVQANEFDGIPNESADVNLKYLTPINTSFLHVVTETVFQEQKHHLTEKTFKPIVLQQPFVLAAPAGCLGYLKSYGFKTFDRWWDEGYDKISNHQQRLQAIADIVNNIAKKDYSELYNMQEEMTEVLEHNRRLFYGSFATDCWHELQQNIKQFEF